MPALNPLLTLDVSTRARANAFAPEFMVSSRSVRSTSDSLAWTLTITRELAAALESSIRVIGVQIEIDRGDGTLVPLLQSEIDGSVNLKASRDGYGARSLSFAVKVLPSRSPFYSAWSRGPHRVKMTGYLGLPGAMQPRPMFDGHVTQCTWEANPSLLRIDAQDTSVLWASQKLAYNLEPGSLRTRKDVFLEVLALYGIPYGQLDFGSNDGGLLYKGISEGGTVDLLPWMAAFLTPIARRLNWQGGVCNVEPSYASGTPTRTYRPNDIANLTVALPGTTDTNAVVMSSTVFAYIGPSGHRTEIEIKIATAMFAPATAVRRQDHTDGSLEDLSVTIDPVKQKVSHTITVRVYDAGTIVTTSVQEWGWYSARACPNEQLADGSVTFNHATDVYQYSDGTWRVEPQEQYQLLRQSVTDKQMGPDAALFREVTVLHQYSARIVPIGYIDEAATETHFPVFLTADGIGWFAGCEVFEDARSPEGSDSLVIGPGPGGSLAANGRRFASNHGYCSTTLIVQYEPDSDAHLGRKSTTLQGYGAFFWPVHPPVAGERAYVFGPTSAKRYGIGIGFVATDLEPIVTTTFTAVDESSHKETTSVLVPGGPWIDVDAARVGASPSPGERIVPGSVPVLERFTAGQTAQPASVTVIDAVRSGLLGKVLPQYSQNDFCETVEELKVCALELLRDKAPLVEFDALIDWTATPGATVSLLLPDAIPSGEILTVWDMDWSFEGKMAQNNQHIAARWLPQELR